jgi:negative regulator of sigma E activity
VPTDDEKFETYLKQFRPVVPDPLAVERAVKVPRRAWIAGAWIVAIAAVVLIALALHLRNTRIGHEAVSRSAAPVDLSRPLTMRAANALLNAAPSYKAVIDDMAFRSENSAVATGKQSAVAVLSKEKIKL